WHNPGQQNNGTEERLERQVLVQQQGQPQAQDKLQNTGHDGVENRVEQRQLRHRVANQVDVIAQPYPFADPAYFGVGKAQPDPQPQGISQEQYQYDGQRQHKQQPQDISVVQCA